MSAAIASPPAIAGTPSRILGAGRLLGFLSPALLLTLWWATCALGWFPAQILVPPAGVVAAFIELWQSGELARHLAATFSRLGFGFGFGMIAALAFGCATAMSPIFDDYTKPLFNAVRTVPSIAFIPILILMFGIGETFKVLVVAKATFFPVALATMEAVRGISERHLDVARVYRLPYPYRLRRVILPAALPSIVTGIRLGLGRSWGVLVAAELIASENGLGQMMEFGRQMFRLDVVLVGVLIAGFVGFALDRGVRALEARLSRWQAAA